MSSRHGLEIRAAAATEAAGLAELLTAAGHAVSARDMADRLDAMQKEPGTTLVALEWGPPSGVVVLHWYRTLDRTRPTAQINTLFVAPDSRRRGIGRLLVKAAAQAARAAGCDDVEVSAGTNNVALQAFCTATGFTCSGHCFSRPLRKKSVE